MGYTRRQDSEVSPNHHLEDLELHQNLPVELKTALSVVENFVSLPRNVLRRTHLQAKCNTEKKD